MAYLNDEFRAVVDAEVAYVQALAHLQVSCEHKIILKFTNSEYLTSRVCEDCGYNESVQWDSTYKYKDQRLCKRAYDVSWTEYVRATPRIRQSEVDYHIKCLER